MFEELLLQNFNENSPEILMGCKLQCRYLYSSVLKLSLLTIVFLALTMPIQAEIKFEEFSQSANINHSGQTYGASWGDFNGDGWPDLWVGNHDTKPSLYLNKQDGTFVDIADEVWSANPQVDTHGAAWADVDNDGDQDLIELVGGRINDDGSMCVGCGRNHFFINQNDKLVESAAAYGIDVSGLARSPLWLDVDNDGKLDLVVVNTRRQGGPPTAVYLQKNNRFVKSSEALKFKDERWSKSDKLRATFNNLMRFEFSTETSLINTHAHLESTQLANLSNGRFLDLVLFSSPTRIYALNNGEFEDITSVISLPKENGISDVAIADFNGDGKNDLYLMKGPFLEPDVIQTDANEIKGTLTGAGRNTPKAITFHSDGELDFLIHPTWLSLDKIFIGDDGRHPDARAFRLSPKDTSAIGTESGTLAKKSEGIAIYYNPESRVWTMQNYFRGQYADFIVRASQSIDQLKIIGFKKFKESGSDEVLIQAKNKFVPKQLRAEAGESNACYSIVAGDFDNDMDIDLYMVCTGPVENLPNRLLENDGKGNFQLVATAGGAAGSDLGRGDVAAIADYDKDGFLDIFITNGSDPSGPFVFDGSHQLFRNLGNDKHWLEIDLEGVKSNRDGIGAIVSVETAGIKQTREQRGGMHRIAQNHQRLHFGLGKYDKIERLTVNWPSGIVQQLKNVSANQILKIIEK